MDVAQRLLRKELRDRSYSDDTQSDSGSPEFGFLHPDHAWHANSRRGSSQSEQLEVEPYELNRDYSRSLPGSRRSSFQSQGGTDSKRECRKFGQRLRHGSSRETNHQRGRNDASIRGSSSNSRSVPSSAGINTGIQLRRCSIRVKVECDRGKIKWSRTLPGNNLRPKGKR